MSSTTPIPAAVRAGSVQPAVQRPRLSNQGMAKPPSPEASRRDSVEIQPYFGPKLRDGAAAAYPRVANQGGSTLEVIPRFSNRQLGGPTIARPTASEGQVRPAVMPRLSNGGGEAGAEPKVSNAEPSAASSRRLAALKQATAQFEGTFVKDLLSKMRSSVGAEKSGPMAGFANDMFDQTIADSVGQTGSFGIANMLYAKFADRVAADEAAKTAKASAIAVEA